MTSAVRPKGPPAGRLLKKTFFILQPALCILHSALPSQPRPSNLSKLEDELTRITKSAPATVGIGVIHVESGREVFVNRHTWFPLASTYKVPMAVEVLTRVDQSKLKLDSLVPIEPADVVPFGSLLTERFGTGAEPGASLAIRRYLELMLILSDNTATDVLLRVLGGTAPVQARLRALGIDSMMISRTVMELGADYTGIHLPARSERNSAQILRMMTSTRPAAAESASRAFLASRKDQGTPESMARLLAKIWRGQALSPSSTDVLKEIMFREETGKDRIRGWLPKGTRVANKTGTLATVANNDVGVIDLPDGSHVVLAVYLRDIKPGTPPAEPNRIIAEIGRAVYDFFVFNPSP